MFLKWVRSGLLGSFVLLLSLGFLGCRKSIPSNWIAMRLPLSTGKVLPGSSPSKSNLKMVYETKETPASLCGRFLITFQRNSYTLRKGKLGATPNLVIQKNQQKIRFKCARKGKDVTISLEIL